MAFSPDGTRVLTGDSAITAARVWDVSIAGDAEIANLPAVVADFGAAAFTSDGRQLVATGAAGSVAVWDAQHVHALRTLGAPPGRRPRRRPGPGYWPRGVGRRGVLAST